MEIQILRANGTMDVGILDPAMLCRRSIRDSRQEAESYALSALLTLQKKQFVLLPYHQEYVFPCPLVSHISCMCTGLIGFDDIFAQISLDPPCDMPER